MLSSLLYLHWGQVTEGGELIRSIVGVYDKRRIRDLYRTEEEKRKESVERRIIPAELPPEIVEEIVQQAASPAPIPVAKAQAIIERVEAQTKKPAPFDVTILLKIVADLRCAYEDAQQEIWTILREELATEKAEAQRRYNDNASRVLTLMMLEN